MSGSRERERWSLLQMRQSNSCSCRQSTAASACAPEAAAGRVRPGQARGL